ncbi:MAG TPA: condensation domain-containing protein, partial [Pyrinomonadaceae bacterium]|nr:condensation domain-containing protein [Pyrinomonadaceae bacterium]
MDELSRRQGKLSTGKLDLIEQLLRKKGINAPSTETIERRAIPSPAPLSFAQERLWFLAEMEPDSPAYNMPAAFRLSGRLDADALRRSLSEVIRRHEILRTTFTLVSDAPAQIIHQAQPFDLPLIDFSHLSEEERITEQAKITAAESARPFDLSQAPLMRATLLRLSEEEHLLLFILHHIICDGWSIKIFVDEVRQLYRGFLTGESVELEELPLQYADFALWQRHYLRGLTLSRQLSYWRAQLMDAPPLLELPADRPRPALQSYRGATHRFTLPSAFVTGLESLARREGATLFMLLLAAFKVLLYRYTGQGDVVVGAPIANRNRAEIEGLIGFFVNTLVLRTKLDGERSFRETLREEKRVCLEAYAHQDLPFEKLIEELKPERSLRHSPLFQVMFDVETNPLESFELPDLSVNSLPAGEEFAKFDLELTISNSAPDTTVSLKYNTDLFDADTATRMLRHFQVLLEAIHADPDRRISEL